MKRTRIAPTKIWAKMSHLTPEHADTEALRDGWVGGRKPPANTIGRPVRQIITTHQQLLEALIENLVAWVVGIEPKQVGTAEQLQDDARGDDRPDTELQDCSLSTGEDASGTARRCQHFGSSSVQEDVRQEEIQHQTRPPSSRACA